MKLHQDAKRNFTVKRCRIVLTGKASLNFSLNISIKRTLFSASTLSFSKATNFQQTLL